MRKVIASMNITLDGFCDHTAVIADDELHENANELFRNADTVLFGRKTYQLMEKGWPPVVKKPTGHKAVDNFAVLINNIHKIVFSNSLTEVHWKNSVIAAGSPQHQLQGLKNLPGRDILIGSPTLIAALMPTGLIDEYQFCIQPIVLGHGLVLFKDIEERIDLKLIKARTFKSGVTSHLYQSIG